MKYWWYHFICRILKLKESGIIEHWYNKYHTEAMSNHVLCKTPERVYVTLKENHSLFLWLSVGIIFSFLILLVELGYSPSRLQSLWGFERSGPGLHMPGFGVDPEAATMSRQASRNYKFKPAMKSIEPAIVWCHSYFGQPKQIWAISFKSD